jgi:hypothetical protein
MNRGNFLSLHTHTHTHIVRYILHLDVRRSIAEWKTKMIEVRLFRGVRLVSTMKRSTIGTPSRSTLACVRRRLLAIVRRTMKSTRNNYIGIYFANISSCTIQHWSHKNGHRTIAVNGSHRHWHGHIRWISRPTTIVRKDVTRNRFPAFGPYPFICIKISVGHWTWNTHVSNSTFRWTKL